MGKTEYNSIAKVVKDRDIVKWEGGNLGDSAKEISIIFVFQNFLNEKGS